MVAKITTHPNRRKKAVRALEEILRESKNQVISPAPPSSPSSIPSPPRKKKAPKTILQKRSESEKAGGDVFRVGFDLPENYKPILKILAFSSGKSLAAYCRELVIQSLNSDEADQLLKQAQQAIEKMKKDA